jgi:hypothetical protein
MLLAGTLEESSSRQIGNDPAAKFCFTIHTISLMRKMPPLAARMQVMQIVSASYFAVAGAGLEPATHGL